MKYFSVLFLLFISCANNYTTVYYTSSLDGELQTLLESSISNIEKNSSSGFLHDNPEDATFKITFDVGNLAPNYLGIAQKSENCRIVLSNNLKDSRYREFVTLTIYHEIGHCFGLQHNDDINSIMHRYIIPYYQDNETSFKNFIKDLQEIRKL